ncbi:MAG: ATP-binding protein [Helicobacter sp.]|nr:ATP-binding protein [Helicobacter sp.]
MPKYFSIDFAQTYACVYRGQYQGYGGYLHPVKDFDAKPLDSFIGIDRELKILCQNTQSFMQGNDASHVLLWGARGCGKSSSIKAVLKLFAYADSSCQESLKLLESPVLMPLRVIEIPKVELQILPFILDFVRELPYCFVVFCDELAFSSDDESYKALKSLLSGSIEGFPKNVLLYATSNMRHLLIEDYAQDTLHTTDAKDEILALSERFGISLGFYTLGTQEYFTIIESLLATKQDMPAQLDSTMRKMALNFATQKGSRNPRIAQEFVKFYHNSLL